MNNSAGIFCRQFAPEVEAIAQVWSTSAYSADEWRVTGKTWGTNSQPFEVSNQNNLRGVAKPGPGRPVDRVLCAANEKIASDLAYITGLPIPPVTLWDRGDAVAGSRYVSISAWAFSHGIEWQHISPRLSPEQLQMARDAASAMQVFDTWVAASDRKDDHLLVADDGDSSHLRLAYIDYAFSATYDWAHGQPDLMQIRPSWPQAVGTNPEVVAKTVAIIRSVTDDQIYEIINRIPTACYFDGAKDALGSGLTFRRDSLNALFQI